LNIEYSNVEKEFNDILYKYFESQKLQDLIERYLTVGQNQMRVSTALLVLTSAIESYIRYGNGKNPNLQKKLNLIICGAYNKENNVSKIIKDNRDWYIHAEESKERKKLSETDLLPYVIDLQNYLREYILKELGVKDIPEVNKLVRLL
uniref:HEPN domain-containing protein n=3 Tax=Lactococcus garvieae TaxID=1363 RepID=UPI0023EC29F3